MEATERDNMLAPRRSSGPEVKDRWNYVKMTSLYAGLTSLFPWNMLITVTGYWNYKLRDVSADGGGDSAGKLSDLQVIYNAYLAIAANVPNAVFVILTAFLGHRFNTKVRFQFQKNAAWIRLYGFIIF